MKHAAILNLSHSTVLEILLCEQNISESEQEQSLTRELPDVNGMAEAESLEPS
jgi:hypothetical protein